MDPFRICLAMGPLAVYFFLMGGLNFTRRPFVVAGTRDAAALGLALSGMILVGPVELFFPTAAASLFGPYVWIFLIVLYMLVLVLVLLMLRPRLVVYNISPDQLRPILADLAPRLDGEARWAGDNLALPSLGIQLHLDAQASMRNVALVSSGPNQNYSGWRKLEHALGEALEEFEVTRNPRAISLVTAGVLTAATLVLTVARDPHAVAQSLLDMLRI